MASLVDIKVPALGESVSEATIGRWLKNKGDTVTADEPLVELETEKVTMEVNAPEAGVLSDISAQEGATVTLGDLLGRIEAGAVGTASTSKTETVKTEAPAPVQTTTTTTSTASTSGSEEKLSPAVQKIVRENDISAQAVQGSGKDGRVLKGDVINFMDKQTGTLQVASGGTQSQGAHITLDVPLTQAYQTVGNREERVKMTRLRKTIATRLKEAQNVAAMLTTFNEIDMSNVMAARAKYKDAFEKKHGVRLGFMSFFIKAAVQALKEIPAVNAEINGDDIVYKNHYDISVAVSAPQGLVVPVIRDADHLTFGEIEKSIIAYSQKAKDGTLSMQDLTGGTFTITNGGIFGSLMSTPILNAPQSAILGMHKIQERPMVVNGEIKVCPMMYVAMTYDHRIIDGREAVTFVVRIKEMIENPERLLFEI